MHKLIKRGLILTVCGILLTACQSKEKQAQKIFLEAEQLYHSGDADAALLKYMEANEIFEKSEYQEIIQHIRDESEYTIAKEMIEDGDLKGAIYILEKIPDFMASQELLNQCYYQLIQQNIEEKKYSDAFDLLEKAVEVRDRDELFSYVNALSEYETGDLETAKTMFESLSGYADSDQYLKNIAAFEALQGEWLRHRYMRDGKLNSYREKIPTPDIVIIGRDVSTILYNLERKAVHSVYNWKLDYVYDDGVVVANNQHGQACYYYNLNEDGELVESDISPKSDNYNAYIWLGDATTVPVAQVEPAIGMTELEVMNSRWGYPNKKNKTTTKSGTSEEWVYDRGSIYFESGTVTMIEH